ncbi:MAG TPA: CUAEP/CCAEP-tail radical SAM protein [Candidatus Acidoferrales bacterium]|nr:CUAEP/CCAEP-tail radical SAM protein [Candidatus Acidoferrales bacterium]
MNVVLISTYELGRQPFGLASPAAWLRRAGAQVRCLDLSRDDFRDDLIRAADLIAFYVPMHTATRLAVMLLDPIRKLNPRAHLCFYGLYAPMNEAYLRSIGVEIVIGGEFEGPLVALLERLRKKDFNTEHTEGTEDTERKGTERAQPAVVSLARQEFLVPERAGLPALKEYAHLRLPDGSHRIVGYTEATRGCKHLCRHCPIVPVYRGAFRVVSSDVVLADVRQQVAAGAQHITFGDPDFFNGPGHAIEIVEALHREFPALSYDVTIKVEHLLRRADLLPVLRSTGCAFVVTAAEAVDDRILERLAKGHTRADFLAALRCCREAGLPLQPTFVPFTPWTTLEGYCDLLRFLVEHDLASGVPPIQLAIRLLIPAGSLLLELEDVRCIAAPFDPAALLYPWRHPDPRVDALADQIQQIVERGERMGRSREKMFQQIWQAAHAAAKLDAPAPIEPVLVARAAVPFLTEPWYC